MIPECLKSQSHSFFTIKVHMKMKIVSFSKSQRWLVSNDGVDCADCYAEMWLVILEVFGSWNSDAFLRLRVKKTSIQYHREIFAYFETSSSHFDDTSLPSLLVSGPPQIHPPNQRPDPLANQQPAHHHWRPPPRNGFLFCNVQKNFCSADWWEAVRTAWRRSCLERSRSILPR